MSQALRKLTGTIAKSNTLVIFINQIRMKIGVMFGNPETTTGGNALKFYASVRMDIRRVGALKDGEKVVGNRTRVKVVKNKMAPPFREVEFDILYGEGISREGDLVDLGAECGAVEKSGAWFGFGGDRIGQGRENAKQFLRDHPDVARKIEAKVLAHYGITRDVGAARLGGGGSAGAGGGATVHTLNPQPKPASEKKSRARRGKPRRANQRRGADWRMLALARIRSRHGLQESRARGTGRGSRDHLDPPAAELSPVPRLDHPDRRRPQEIREAGRGGDLEGAPRHRHRHPARRADRGSRTRRPVHGRVRGADPEGHQAGQGQLLGDPAGGLPHPAAGDRRQRSVHDGARAGAARLVRRPTSSWTRW